MLNETETPDLEELAAFIDGRLSGERKERVEERLLRDGDYYEIFLETSRFLREHDTPAVAAPAAGWRRRQVVLPLAATALLAVTLSLLFSRRTPPTGEWLAQLDPADVVGEVADWDDPGWPRLRSGGPDSLPAYRPEQRALRLGTRAFDLRLALAAGNRAAAAIAAGRLERLASDDLLPVAAVYGRLRQQMAAGELETLEARVIEIEDSLRDIFADSPVEAEHFLLGGWAEAGRLAALSENAAALAVVAGDAPSAPREIKPYLDRLQGLTTPAPVDPAGFRAAATAFTEILHDFAGDGARL